MAAKPDSPLDDVNKSGFPFQIALRSLIERTRDRHGWTVQAEELYWKHPHAEESGYIDLLVADPFGGETLLLESKRVVQDGKWHFLATGGTPPSIEWATIFYVREPTKEAAGFCGWSDFLYAPTSPQVNYCVVPKRDDKNAMLEHIADSLLPSVEAIGLKMAGEVHQDSCGCERFIIPAVVTNARLLVCKMAPEKMDLKSGILDEEACTFEEVPMVRFRKNLKAHCPRIDGPNARSGVLRLDTLDRDRSILIINAEKLPEILPGLKGRNLLINETIRQRIQDPRTRPTQGG